MMKYTLLTLSLLVCSIIFAQDFQGMAVYESKTSLGDSGRKMPQMKDVTPEMQKAFMDRMKKMMEKTYVLNFDKTSSIYEEEEKLEAPAQSNGMGMHFGMMKQGVYYKNVKNKTFAEEKDVFGKEFLVKDSLPKYNWVLGSETKQIGNYTCFKATAVEAIDTTRFTSFRDRMRKEREKETEKDSTKTTNFMDDFKMPTERVITAWYSPEIPINQGPKDYWGLPGLILEVNDGKTTILCSKIVLNSKDKVEIKEPKKGKEVSQAEYDDIMQKKMEEMAEQFQNRRGGGARGIMIGH